MVPVRWHRRVGVLVGAWGDAGGWSLCVVCGHFTNEALTRRTEDDLNLLDNMNPPHGPIEPHWVWLPGLAGVSYTHWGGQSEKLA